MSLLLLYSEEAAISFRHNRPLVRRKVSTALVYRAAYFLHLEKVHSTYPRNMRATAVDKGQDLGNGDAKASFGRDRFLAINSAGRAVTHLSTSVLLGAI